MEWLPKVYALNEITPLKSLGLRGSIFNNEMSDSLSGNPDFGLNLRAF
jgi:hypothetical protein